LRYKYEFLIRKVIVSSSVSLRLVDLRRMSRRVLCGTVSNAALRSINRMPLNLKSFAFLRFRVHAMASLDRLISVPSRGIKPV